MPPFMLALGSLAANVAAALCSWCKASAARFIAHLANANARSAMFCLSYSDELARMFFLQEA
jgi:hypothetical protein